MSSDLQSTLQFLVLNNYLTLAGVTAVVYDYVLTFSKEVEYVWCRPWSWVSTMFVVARYIGLCWIVAGALIGSSLVPGPLEVMLMILRVYAMWNRSRTILRVLLLVYIIQTLITVVLDGIYNNPNTHVSVTIVRILDFSVCSASVNNLSYTIYYVALRLVLSGLLVILAVFQTLKQSFEMYKATKQWQPNRYMRKLIKDGILYFVVNVLSQVDNLFSVAGSPGGNIFRAMFLQAFVSIAFYIAIPRFIISIRELYDRDIHRGFHIDTGFGVQSRSNAGADATVSAIVFEDGNQSSEVAGDTVTSADLEMGRLRVHGSGSNEDPSIGDRE
ncbi:hypothetical protein EV363DRAFT_1555210 [Boletus edulis]|nr:hypothetical protein EV363DRAFT_1555210 [Boletus edulis]